MRKSISSLVLFLALTTSVFARDYTVQVGAYETISAEAIERAQKHGETFQRLGNDNIERLSIGRFSSRTQAENKRDQLQASGFSDAFVSTIDTNSSSTSFTNNHSSSTSSFTNNHSSSTSSNHTSAPRQQNYTTNRSTYSTKKSSYTVNDLSADERSKASFLDGQLRILSGGKFYTVDQYRSSNQYQY